MKVLYFLLLLLVINKGSAGVFKKEVHITEGGSFVQYVTNANEILSCNLTSTAYGKDICISLDLQSKNTSLCSKFEDETNVTSRIYSLGSSYCGFKLLKFQKGDPTVWKLSVEKKTNVFEEAFTIFRYDLGKMHTIKKVTVGSTIPIECGKPITQSQDFCQLYNPKSEFVMESVRCNFLINTVTMSDLGSWRCISGTPQSMDTLEYIVELIDEEPPMDEGWVEETDEYYKVGCKITSLAIPIVCRMVDPTGTEYLIREGLATERYTSIHTNFANRTCNIEIPKPLLEHEHGIWRCIMNDRGSVLIVGNVTDLQSEEPLSVDIDEFTNLKVMCKVPYSAINCYIISPNGERIDPDIQSRVYLGECSHSVDSASTEHNGTWSCFFIKRQEVQAQIVKVQVNVRKNVSCTETVYAAIDASAELSCKTSGVGMRYCYFITPTGQTYHLFNDYSSENLAYSGRGLEYGDCGIVLFNVEENQYGEWKCIFRKNIIYKEPENVHSLQLLRSIEDLDTTQASSIGIFIAVIVIALVVVIVVIIKRRRNIEIQATSSTENMHEMQEPLRRNQNNS